MKTQDRDTLSKIINYQSANKRTYKHPQDIYGSISCILHKIAGNNVNQLPIDEELIEIIGECCIALSQLYSYKRIKPDDQYQTEVEIKLIVATKLLKDILELYKNTELEKVEQKGKPPKDRLYFHQN